MADAVDPPLGRAGQGDQQQNIIGGDAQAAAAAAAAAGGAAPPRRGPSSIFSGKRLMYYGAASTAAAAAVTFNAFRQRSNYYAAAVWLGRSNGCMLILLNFGIFMSIMYALAVQFVFFGQLRPIEVEHLHERAWYALTESLLAMTIFRDEFDVKFIIMFGTLLFLKVFHWLSDDRVDYMEQTPSVTKLFHVRMVAILFCISIIDLGLVAWSLEAVYLDSKQLGLTIMFATEFMVLTANSWSTGAKYIINTIDSLSQDVWETKSMYVFYVDLLTDGVKLVVYTFFFGFILATYGFPFNLVRDVVFTARSFFSRVRDLIRYREATKNMNERYPNASVADVQGLSDPTCIICRDEMLVAGAEGVPPGQPSSQETPKKLPCGHIFHFHCLRSWLERQQSCPTCRRTVLQPGATPAPGAVDNNAAAAANGDVPPAAGGAAPVRPPPPAPGARPQAPLPARARNGTAPATQTNGQAPTTTAPSRTSSSQPDATSSQSQAGSSSRAVTGEQTANGRASGSGSGDDWTIRGSLERLSRGLAAAKAEADQRRNEHASGSTSAVGRASRNGRNQTSSLSSAIYDLRPTSEELERIPMTLLEILFETSAGGQKDVVELSSEDRVALPLTHPSTTPGGPARRSIWVPPRPDHLPTLRSTTALEDRQEFEERLARLTRSGAPSPSTMNGAGDELNEARTGEAEDATVTSPPAPEPSAEAVEGGSTEGTSSEADPQDPRAAVRAAALRRFAALGASSPKSAYTNRSNEVTTSDVKGKGKEVERADDVASTNQSTSANGSSLAIKPQLYPLGTLGTTAKVDPKDLPFALSTDLKSAGAPRTRSQISAPLSDEDIRERLESLVRLQDEVKDAVGELHGMLQLRKVSNGETAEQKSD
ncbi:E3 ubiquitin-protein ligase hrd1 [Tilletia horrida]|nr:E3 ubiquitin-protein ligase hrd1 [Tilletia horrida]